MRGSTNRLQALLMALLFALSFSVGAVAAEAGPDAEITGFSEEFGAGGYLENGVEKRYGHIDDFAYLTGTQPGTEYFLPLRTKDFEWKGSGVLPMQERFIEQLGIEFWWEEKRGSEVFDRVEFTQRDGTMGLLLDFVDEWVSVEEQEFELRAAFQVAGEEYEFLIRGTIRNRARGVYATTGTVTLGVGRMATGYADVSGVRFDLGAGLTMTTDIEFAQTVYGAAKEMVTEHDRETLDAYPQIVRTIYLDTINLRGNVRIDAGDLGVLHVYNAQLVYLGTTAGPVRQETLYYLSTTKL